MDDNTVYYRVSTRLYSVPIANGTIGAATLLATNNVIEDAHWAFLKR